MTDSFVALGPCTGPKASHVLSPKHPSPLIPTPLSTDPNPTEKDGSDRRIKAPPSNDRMSGGGEHQVSGSESFPTKTISTPVDPWANTDFGGFPLGEHHSPSILLFSDPIRTGPGGTAGGAQERGRHHPDLQGVHRRGWRGRRRHRRGQRGQRLSGGPLGRLVQRLGGKLGRFGW